MFFIRTQYKAGNISQCLKSGRKMSNNASVASDLKITITLPLIRRIRKPVK